MRKRIRLQQKIKFDEDQTTKLACDAYAFAETSRLIVNHRETTGAQPGSTAYNSLSTVLMVNIGLALELNLKLVHCKLETAIHPKKLYTHELAELYDLLDKAIQSKLDALFDKAKSEFLASGSKEVFKVYIRSKAVPKGPDPIGDFTFRGLLAYLDQITLFLRRYSFEKFSPNEWWVEPDFGFLTKVLDEVAKFADALAKPSSR